MEEVAIANDKNDDLLLGKKIPMSGVTWNEDAAWKLSLEGTRMVRQLLLGTIDGGDNHPDDGRGSRSLGRLTSRTASPP